MRRPNARTILRSCSRSRSRLRAVFAPVFAPVFALALASSVFPPGLASAAAPSALLAPTQHVPPATTAAPSAVPSVDPTTGAVLREETESAGPGARPLSLDEAVRTARSRGFDILAAEAEIRGARADVRAAGALPNPTLTGYVGRTFNYDPNAPGCEGCSRAAFFGELSDEGLLEGAITRKRALRAAVARHALDVARYARADAERMILAHVKIQYLQTVAARTRLEFVRDVAASLTRAVDVNRVRYPRVIDEGQLARVEQESLRAQQEVDRSRRAYRQEQIDLGLVLGMTGEMPELDVDRSVLAFRVPSGLQNLDKSALLAMARDNRPDRKLATARAEQGEANVTLARRERFPDIELRVQYQQIGTGQDAAQPPTLSFGAALPLPILNQRQGVIGRAEADRDSASIERRRVETMLTADLESAYNAFVTAKAIVERYENQLLERARRAREITLVQFNAGSATLTDLLDAQRSWVQAESDHNAELVNYWAAVFLLEQAIGKELVP